MPRDNSLELSTHSQYSAYKTGGVTDTQGTMTTASVRVSTREGVTSEILTLRGGKGVVVRWKRKDAVEADGQSGTAKQNGDHHHNYNNHSCSSNQLANIQPPRSGQARRPGPKVSKAIRSTYTGKSIESKKKVIRMLFVLVAEFFICWTPLHILVINT